MPRCSICWTPFEAKRADAAFCSPTCRSRSSRRADAVGIIPPIYGSFEGAMRELVYMDSPEVLRVMAAVWCVHHFRGLNPIWLFIIAPSSSAKTELLRPLSVSPLSTCLSQLTARTFVSGFKPAKVKDGETAQRATGLLDRATEKARANGGDPLLVVKDFTTILNMRPEDRAVVMSQLREVKDGALSSEYGNGVTSAWSGRIGFVAAVTDQIEEAIADSAKFGDRYAYYRMDAIDPEKAIERMLSNRAADTGETVKRAAAALGELSSEAASAFGAHGPVPPPELIATGGRVNALSILATRLRTPVNRNPYTREITSVYPAESPARHVSQLTSFASGFMALRGGAWSDDDYPLLRKLALGSAPVVKLRIVEALFNGSLSTGECAEALSLPKSAVRYPLDDLFAAKMIRRQDPVKADGDEGGGKSYVYSIAEDTAALMERAGYSHEFPNAHAAAVQFGGKVLPDF